MIPPKANAAFVAAMEDVLDVYTRPHDPERPLVCLDETSKQLVAETRQPLALRRGQPARYDYEYKRGGTANLFMLFAPLEGFRHVAVTERRTAIDYAHILRDLADMAQGLQGRMASAQRELAEAIAQDGIAMDTLSMGMSDDYRAAILEGATIVRIGTALFGPRDDRSAANGSDHE